MQNEVRSEGAASVQEVRPVDSKTFAIEAARMAADTRCRHVVVLDVRGISPVTDYMVIATGSSTRQMRSVVKDVEEMAVGFGDSPMSRSGYEGESWVLLDFVHIVIHLMSDQARAFYDLDNLWGDAERVDWQAGYTPKPV